MAKKQGFSLQDLKDKNMVEVTPGVFKKVSNPQPRDKEKTFLQDCPFGGKEKISFPLLFPLTCYMLLYIRKLVSKNSDINNNPSRTTQLPIHILSQMGKWFFLYD